MTPSSIHLAELQPVSNPEASILHRVGRPLTAPTPLQSQVDGLVGSFTEQATDWRSLAAMMAGGVAYRVGRMGVMGLGSGNAVRAASIGLGLSAEVSTFELVHRGLQSAHPVNPNLWRWNGNGGLAQGLLQSFITFGTLKSAGHLTRAENVILQHFAQDTAMVAGHQISGALQIAPRPEGSLAEQFLHAEATNLQIGAGMALAHRFMPGVYALERGLDLSLQSSVGANLVFAPNGDRDGRSQGSPLQAGLQPAFATPGGRAPHPTDLIVAMSGTGENGNGRKKSDPPVRTEIPAPRSSAPEPPAPVYRARFQQGWEALNEQKRASGRRALQMLFDYFRDGILPRGLDLKKLSGGREEYYQFRISQKDRVIFQRTNGHVEFIMVGNHDEVNQLVRNSDVSDALGKNADPLFDPLKTEASPEPPSSATPVEPRPGRKKERPERRRPWLKAAERSEAAPEASAPSSSENPAASRSPLEQVLGEPFPHDLKKAFPEVASVEPAALRRIVRDFGGTLLSAEGRAPLQLLAFLRRIRGLLDPALQGQIDTFSEETLTHPGNVKEVSAWAFEQYETLRASLISKIPLELAGSFAELKGERRRLLASETGTALQGYLSRKRLPHDLQQTLNRLADEALQDENPLNHYWRSAAVVFLENFPRILESPAASRAEVPAVKSRLERDLPELNVLRKDLLTPSGEIAEGDSLGSEAKLRIQRFWSAPENELLFRARWFHDAFLKDRPEGVELGRLLRRFSLFAAAGADPSELAEAGNQQFLILNQRERRGYFSSMVFNPSGRNLLALLPEIARIETSRDLPERAEFERMRVPSYETNAKVALQILSSHLRTKLEAGLWDRIPSELEAPPEAMEGLTLHLLNLYSRYREELRTAPDRTASLSRSIAAAVDHLEKELGWRFGEILYLPEPTVATKRERLQDYLEGPIGDFHLRFYLPGGLNGEIALSASAHEEMQRELKENGRYKLGSLEAQGDLVITPDTRVEITPVTPFDRLKIQLQVMLPNRSFRLLRMGLDTESPMWHAFDRDLNRAARLLLLGFPSPWVIQQLSERMIETYENGREEFFDHIQTLRPGIFSEIIDQLPDSLMIDATGFLGLITDPRQKWPAEIGGKIRDFNESLDRAASQKLWSSSAEMALAVATRLARFYLLHRDSILKALGVTQDVREILTGFEQIFSDEAMPELYQVSENAFRAMEILFSANLPAHQPGLVLHQMHLRSYILANWTTVPSGLKREYQKALGTDREKMPYRTILRSLKFYQENRARILPHLPLSD